MAIRTLGLLVALLLATSAQFSPVQAQKSDSQQVGGGDRQKSAVGAEYAAQCVQNGLRCTLVYGDVPAKAEPTSNTKSSPQRKPLMIPQEPVVSGPLAVAVVLVGLVVAVGLWIRFGNGGVLLSSAPRDIKRQGEAPESWRTSAAEAEEKPSDFLQRIAAMADRRQALVLLLRHCLLHAADVTGTRLFRSDTERAVFARLPDNMPDRDRLENFLTAVELVHYGGRTLAESHFGVLLTTARGLLSSGRVANA
ncbi:hypothetical protein [Rhizobium laguerreae]|uniref:hypothetical protein n=1 Tax=Rhizobium laguerreae TaxID=1076926 RepID=UPI001C8FD18C|nr:hypothetical protein [Rhizobium laguerreae]MBY3050113.1 hypothetical protein [Rhizobium laguerreae]MBY3195950.1 hypothetical protein [Rhizobium laguerreae]MBY3206567.1 hypothetical protein [Rhizobium laguerreae]MBY3346782.1 hypothetical protein [Rhizobium laguerreae]MBY3353743.1 hypothetical protein [Rhizobium laguerreae]